MNNQITITPGIKTGLFDITIKGRKIQYSVSRHELILHLPMWLKQLDEGLGKGGSDTDWSNNNYITEEELLTKIIMKDMKDEVGE